MAVFKRGKVFHYQFMVNGRRYRGSTKETTPGKAKQFESLLIGKIVEGGGNAQLKKSPVLTDFAPKFFAYLDARVEGSQLGANTRRSYKAGWRLLKPTHVAHLRLDQIGTADAAILKFPGSASNGNTALRTLRRMLSYAAEAGILRAAPRVNLLEEHGREALIEPWLEEMLIEFAPDYLASILVIMMDCGMRPEEVMRMRWENVLWDRGLIFNEYGKTRRARRHLPMTDRMLSGLRVLQQDATTEWVFPSPRASSGHRVNVNKAWGQTLGMVKRAIADRKLKGTLTGVVLYSARHTYATEFLANGGELSKLSMLMGHSSILVTQKYLHPSTAGAADLMNRHNRNKAGLRLVKNSAVG